MNRLAGAAVGGLCAFALAAHLILLAGWTVPVWLLPLALALGGSLAALRVCVPRPPAAGRLPPLVLGTVLLAVLVPGVHGALATPPRTWDGFAGWWVRAQVLAPPADLSRPFFSDPAVYAHSKTYPVLLPLFAGSLERLVPGAGGLAGPLAYLGLVLVVLGAARRRVGPVPAFATAAAVALTSAWFAPGAGALDSGYGEPALAFALALAAAGLLLSDPFQCAAGLFLLPLVKPEGLLWALLGLAAVQLRGERPVLRRTAFAACLLAALLRGLLAPRLTGAAPGLAGAAWAGPAAALALALLGHAARRLPARARAPLAAVLLLSLAALLLFLPLDGAQDPLLGALRGARRRLAAALTHPGELVLGWLQGLTFLRRIGFAYVALAIAAAADRESLRRRPALLAFVLLGLGASLAAVPLLGGDALAHAFRSRFDRLLLQWSAPVWLLLAESLAGSLAALRRRPAADRAARRPDCG